MGRLTSWLVRLLILVPLAYLSIRTWLAVAPTTKAPTLTGAAGTSPRHSVALPFPSLLRGAWEQVGKPDAEKGPLDFIADSLSGFLSSVTHGSQHFALTVSLNNADEFPVALCLVPPGEIIPPFTRGKACGGVDDYILIPEASGNDGDDQIVKASEFSANWLGTVTRPGGSSPSEPLSQRAINDLADYTLVIENHSRKSASVVHYTVEAGVMPGYAFSAVMHSVRKPLTDLATRSREIGLSLRNLQLPSFISGAWRVITDAYAVLRPASCAEQSAAGLRSWGSSCRMFRTGEQALDLIVSEVCGTLAEGHIALVAIVALNVLAFLPSVVDPTGWGLSYDKSGWGRMTSSMFAHGSLQHIAGNMIVLLSVGGEVSEALDCDPLLFTAFYLACGYVAALFCVYLQSRNTLTVGASGAVSGVIVALSVLRPHGAVKVLGHQAGSPILFILGTLASDVFRDFQERAKGRSGISYVGHLGGGIGGYVLASLRLALMK